MNQSPRIRTLILPAAGLGTRMRAFDPTRPKELLPIGGQPIIRHAVAEAIAAGIERVILIIRQGKESLAAAVRDMAVDLEVVYQPQQRGEIDALLQAKPLAAGQPLAILYPDNVVIDTPPALTNKSALKALVDQFEKNPTGMVVALAAVTEKTAPAWSHSGRVDLESAGENLYRIKKHYIKGPGPFIPRFTSELRTVGMWVVDGDLYEVIDRLARDHGGTGEFTDKPVRDWYLKNRVYLGMKPSGQVFDAGNPEGYLKCLEID